MDDIKELNTLLNTIITKLNNTSTAVSRKPEIKKLWTNASPTSRFPAQTITLTDEIENYVFWFITFKYWYNHATIKLSGFFPVGQYVSIDSSYDYNDSRNITITGNKATIEADIRIRSYSSTAYIEETGGIIPVEIYGVKGGL